MRAPLSRRHRPDRERVRVRSEVNPTTPVHPADTRGTEDESEKVLRGIGEALEHRAGARDDLGDHGAAFRGMSMSRIGEEYLRRCLGISDVPSIPAAVARMIFDPRVQMRAGYHSTTDFPEILANVANKVMMASFAEQERTFVPIAKQSNASDFKERTRLKLGSMKSLQKVPESGEVQYGTFGEHAEKYAIATYALAIAYTRQMMINDDLGALQDIPSMFGDSSARVQNELVWALVTGNVTMGDGNALFSAAHANTGTGALAEAALKPRERPSVCRRTSTAIASA